MIAEADCLKSLIDTIRTGRPPEYGAANARTDQAVYVAMKSSMAQNGAPFDIH